MKRLAPREMTLLPNLLLQAHPLHQTHDNEQAIFPLVDIVNGDNIGVVQPGNGAGLALKAFDPGLVLQQHGPQLFQGHQPIQGGIPAFVDNGKAALAQLF
jgi:hypothetical protein